MSVPMHCYYLQMLIGLLLDFYYVLIYAGFVFVAGLDIRWFKHSNLNPQHRLLHCLKGASEVYHWQTWLCNT